MAVLDGQTVCKADYDACAFFKEEIDKLHDALKKHEDSLRNGISETLTANGTVKKGLFHTIIVFDYKIFSQMIGNLSTCKSQNHWFSMRCLLYSKLPLTSINPMFISTLLKNSIAHLKYAKSKNNNNKKKRET